MNTWLAGAALAGWTAAILLGFRCLVSEQALREAREHEAVLLQAYTVAKVALRFEQGAGASSPTPAGGHPGPESAERGRA